MERGHLVQKTLFLSLRMLLCNLNEIITFLEYFFTDSGHLAENTSYF